MRHIVYNGSEDPEYEEPDELMWDRSNPDPSYYGEEGGD